VLCCAVLCCAVLCCAVLCCAVLWPRSSLVCCKEQDDDQYGSEAYPEGYKGETPWMYGEPPAGSCTLDVDYFVDGAKLTKDGLCVGTVKASW